MRDTLPELEDADPEPATERRIIEVAAITALIRDVLEADDREVDSTSPEFPHLDKTVKLTLPPPGPMPAKDIPARRDATLLLGRSTLIMPSSIPPAPPLPRAPAPAPTSRRITFLVTAVVLGVAAALFIGTQLGPDADSSQASPAAPAARAGDTTP